MWDVVSMIDLVLSTVDKGMIEVSVSASGKVVPAFEEIINSPINSRIVEVYRKGGDSVEIGTPILKLDLQSTETEYKKLLDEEQMRCYKLDQLRVNNQTKLSDMAMQIKVSAMKLICCTRYGNVMCSRGSVIPLWIDQIRNGNPITLTEPNMTRFIMSLEEAVDRSSARREPSAGTRMRGASPDHARGSRQKVFPTVQEGLVNHSV